LCSGQRSKTLREDASLAKLILCGTLANSRLVVDKDGLSAGGTTDLEIKAVLKTDPILAGRNVVELPRYVPTDPKNPPKFIVFADVFNGRLDPYRGIPIQSPDLLDYVKGAMTLGGRDSTKALLYFFNYLDHRDPTIADDAFLEFAKAGDQEIGQLVGRLDAQRLRKWVQDPQTPSPRLNLYGFLLGACGEDRDTELLRFMVKSPNESHQAALSGLLSGYIYLRQKEGWELACAVLQEPRQPFARRVAVLGALRFYHAWRPRESGEPILRCLDVLINQPDMADLAIEDLRRWQMWDLTGNVLAQFAKESHSAPITRRAILRYGLSCPDPAARDFIASQRKLNAGLVADVEESLQFEKQN
jgi:hypothetical protein